MKKLKGIINNKSAQEFLLISVMIRQSKLSPTDVGNNFHFFHPPGQMETSLAFVIRGSR